MSAVGCKAFFAYVSLMSVMDIVFSNDFARYSFKELKSKFKYYEFPSANEFPTAVGFGKMKMISFNESESLYVGGINSIYRLDLENLKLKAKTDDKSSIWRFLPKFSRWFKTKYTYTTPTSYEFARFSLDGCLSTADRAVVNLGRIDPQFPYFQLNAVTMRQNDIVITFDEQWENFTCYNSFIRGLEVVKDPEDDEYVLWACGTFGGFPRAYLFDLFNLSLKRNVTADTTLATCARWPDEPMATVVSENEDLYVASGWGLYRPDKSKPDVQKNNSTMLYSDWRLLQSGHAWFSRMAMVLGRDVNFIPYVKETENYLYFFGREVSPQFTYINTMSNEITQSFILRICKNDSGYRYTASEDAPEFSKMRGEISKLLDFYVIQGLSRDMVNESFYKEVYEEIYHMPTKHFVSARKYPFGCYLKRYDGAQSLNRFWGGKNIIYFNRLADVNISFDWVNQYGQLDPEKYFSFYFHYFMISKEFEVPPHVHVWNPLFAAFSSSGLRSSRDRGPGYRGTTASGAICQFTFSDWKDDILLKDRDPAPPENMFYDDMKDEKEVLHSWRLKSVKNKRQFPIYPPQNLGSDGRIIDAKVTDFHTIKHQYEEFLALYGTQRHNFYDKISSWFQGGQIHNLTGIDFNAVPRFSEDDTPIHKFADTGQCLKPNETDKLTVKQFLDKMRLASTAWPTEWDTWCSKTYDAFFHMNPVQVAGDNASFVAEGVEFLKMFVILQNFTKYVGGNLTSPLVYSLLVTTEGDLYRVVMCDLVNLPQRVTDCEFRNTDQPYITRLYQPMRGRHAEENYHDKFRQVRVSSLLSVWRITARDDEVPGSDIQSPIVKDAVYSYEDHKLFVSTHRRIRLVEVTPEAICSSYRSCVHCASDLLCGWSNEFNVCEVFKRGSSVQDVLGRGEICQTYLKVIAQKKTLYSQPLLLNCSGENFFRGIISWKFKGITIDPHNSTHRRHFIHRGSSLVILPRAITATTSFECIGTSMDTEATTVLNKYEITLGKSTDQLLAESDSRRFKRGIISRYNSQNVQHSGELWCFYVGKCT